MDAPAQLPRCEQVCCYECTRSEKDYKFYVEPFDIMITELYQTDVENEELIENLLRIRQYLIAEFDLQLYCYWKMKSPY